MSKYIVPSPKVFHDKNTAEVQKSWIDQIDKLDLTKVSNALFSYFKGEQSLEEATDNAYEEFCSVIAHAILKDCAHIKEVRLGEENIFVCSDKKIVVCEENNHD